MQVVDRPATGTFFETELFLSIARVGALGVRSKSDLCLEETSEFSADNRISSFKLGHPRNGTIVERVRFESGPKVKLGILQRRSSGRRLAERDSGKLVDALVSAVLLQSPLANQLAQLLDHCGIQAALHGQIRIG